MSWTMKYGRFCPALVESYSCRSWSQSLNKAKVLSNMGNFPVYYILLNFPLLFFSYFSLEVAQWLISLNLSDIELWHHRCTLCIGICGILDFSTDVYYWDMRQMKKPWKPQWGIEPRPPKWHARTLPLSYQFLCIGVDNFSGYILFYIW